MQPNRPPAPGRGALFYSASLLLLATVGAAIQRSLGATGLVLAPLLLFLGLAVGFAVVAEKRPLTEVFRLRALSPAGVAKSIGLGVISWALIQLLGSLILTLVESAGGKMPTLYTDLAQSGFALALLTRALVPALCEETAFRGYIQWSLGPLGDRAAILITGLLFGIMHFSLIRLVPLALLGLLFATAVQRSGSILPSVIMHLVNNTIVLVLMFFVKWPEGGLPTLMTIPMLIVGILALGATAWALARSFGPADLARGRTGEAAHVAATAADTDSGAPPAAWRARAALLLIPLLPALLLYGFAVSYELSTVFGVK